MPQQIIYIDIEVSTARISVSIMSRGGYKEGLDPSLSNIKLNNLSHFLKILSLLLNEFQGFGFATGIMFSFQGLKISVVVIMITIYPRPLHHPTHVKKRTLTSNFCLCST